MMNTLGVKVKKIVWKGIKETKGDGEEDISQLENLQNVCMVIWINKKCR